MTPPELADNPLDDLVASDATDTTSTTEEPVQPEEGQGQAAAEPSAVQPEGQGQQDATTGLYDLSTVPEEYRSEVERIAKDIDRNANAKFQEHAEYRKSWEPFESLGINELDPEGLGSLLEFAQAISDPETAREALLNLAGALEIDLGAIEAEADEPDPLKDIQARLDAFEQAEASRKEQAEIAQLREQALTAYQAEYAEIEQLNGKPFSSEEKQRLIDLAKRFQADSDRPIEAAYKFINSIAGQAEKALVDGQPTPPAPAEPSGRASSPVQPVDSFDEALRLHLERNASASH